LYHKSPWAPRYALWRTGAATWMGSRRSPHVHAKARSLSCHSPAPHMPSFLVPPEISLVSPTLSFSYILLLNRPH
jgi:hypothetical protein